MIAPTSEQTVEIVTGGMNLGVVYKLRLQDLLMQWLGVVVIRVLKSDSTTVLSNWMKAVY